eukprot:Rhum_TRINITY_DN25265_c0_g1::Rhum_TRINITY_DN25265_c0_g1_i1::g.181588::m.181588
MHRRVVRQARDAASVEFDDAVEHAVLVEFLQRVLRCVAVLHLVADLLHRGAELLVAVELLLVHRLALRQRAHDTLRVPVVLLLVPPAHVLDRPAWEHVHDGVEVAAEHRQRVEQPRHLALAPRLRPLPLRPGVAQRRTGAGQRVADAAVEAHGLRGLLALAQRHAVVALVGRRAALGALRAARRGTRLPLLAEAERGVVGARGRLQVVLVPQRLGLRGATAPGHVGLADDVADVECAGVEALVLREALALAAAQVLHPLLAVLLGTGGGVEDVAGLHEAVRVCGVVAVEAGIAVVPIPKGVHYL